jgi:FAD/FMN-containing dehydrogenase/Fe-S oxidoreductase
MKPTHTLTEEIEAALKAAGVRHVDSSTLRRAEFGSDASNYRIIPTLVVFPFDRSDVLATLEVAGKHGVAVTARGGGTSTAGNAIGDGVVLDFSRHMNRVISVDPDARIAVVEPGAILDAITAAGSSFGLRFGPDPSTHARATLGGSIGNNACGSRALRYGRTADNVVALEVTTALGECFTARAAGADGLTTVGPQGPELQRLVTANLTTIRQEFGRFRRQVSGFSLEHLLPENEANVAKFLVGTEGTLALVLEGTVNLVESPRAVALAVLGYEDMPAAAEAAPEIAKLQPVALEGIDSRLVDVVRSLRGASSVPDLPRGAGWLLVETAGASVKEAVANAEKVIECSSCLDSSVVIGADAEALWRIREDGVGLGGRTPAGAPAWPGWEDSAVPPESLAPYLRDLRDLLTEHRLDSLMYGHFGDGCVHMRIDFPLADKPIRYREFVVAAAQLVGGYGGSLSGEHGDGRARSELLRYMYSPSALRVFSEIKRLFDPGNVLNPGIINEPAAIEDNLRLTSARPIRTRLAFSYPHDQGDFSTAVHRCVGVGKCRVDATGSDQVMCPSYVATRDETHSTRGRARVLQELANGGMIKGWAAPEVIEALDLCLACKGCKSDCPAGVDMATYKAEALFQRYSGKIRPRAHYALGWLPRWARLAGAFPALPNLAMRRVEVAKVIKLIGGIDQRRPLPTFAPMSFRSWFADHPVAYGTPVMLWVDTFTNVFSPEVGIAAVAVLEDAGYSVQITQKSVCCGLTWISTGQLTGARRQLRRSLDALAPAIDEGIPIVGLEPSCTAVLRSDIRELLGSDSRSSRVATLTKTLAELLRSTQGWTPPDLSGVVAVAQPHCHHHAVMGWSEDAALLADAGASVKRVGNCCGLAGNFGFEKGHYEVSTAIAETTLLPELRDAPSALVLADGFSCRTQIDHLLPRPRVHLAQLLALGAQKS